MDKVTWNNTWREDLWSGLDQDWDLIIVGGGITGAGILREAVRMGMRAVLIDAADFAAGTSSRSSKLVHGGFRYLKNAQLKMTLESVHERERLLREGRGLINRLGFLHASYRGDHLPTWMFGMGLVLYDTLAFKWQHRYYDAYDIHELSPNLKEDQLAGGYRYFDAQTDDARLVLRLLREAVKSGGIALNYAQAVALLRSQSGRVSGVVVEDQSSEGQKRTLELMAPVVINATGAWVDELRGFLGATPRLRKLRGSHLVFSASRFPLTRAVSFLHPSDRRPVFAIPWEGVVIFGTTDVDHPGRIEKDVAISMEEAEYLLSSLQVVFLNLGLDWNDIQATYAGIRPVVDTGKIDPSKESREHILWNEKGLLTIAGGKLTTFRLMACDALRAVARMLKKPFRPPRHERTLDIVTGMESYLGDLPAQLGMRLAGRYAADVPSLVEAARPGELDAVETLPTLWGELRWAAGSEAVVHLDDLLLRRVRLGLQLPQGGINELDRIRSIVQEELGWDEARWEDEVRAYRALWQHSYAPPHLQPELSPA